MMSFLRVPITPFITLGAGGPPPFRRGLVGMFALLVGDEELPSDIQDL